MLSTVLAAKIVMVGPVFSAEIEQRLGGFITNSSELIGCTMPISNSIEGRLLNWSKIRSLSQLDDCIFAIAGQISNPDLLVEWLRSNGLIVDVQVKYSSRTMKASFGLDGEGVLISGSIQRDKILLNLSLIELLGVHNLSIGIILDDVGMPVRVKSTLTRI